MEKVKISLKAARVNADKTLQEVADHLGVSPRTIQSYEKGTTVPDYDVAEELSRFYNMPLDFIFLRRVSL